MFFSMVHDKMETINKVKNDNDSKDTNITSNNKNLGSIFKKWYVIQVYSGHEKRVKNRLEERVKREKLIDFFGKFLVPTEDIVEIRSGQKRRSERKFFPGYVLIEMKLTKVTWQLVKRTPGVNGFVGGTSDKPIPIKTEEANKILSALKYGEDKTIPKPRTTFKIGQVVRVLEGPFVDFTGVVEEINYDKSLVRVSISIFGRQTPVELEFSQVEKDS